MFTLAIALFTIMLIVNLEKLDRLLELTKYSKFFYVSCISLFVIIAGLNVFVPAEYAVASWFMFLFGVAVFTYWFMNKQLVSILFFSLSALSNGSVKVANNGKMPVAPTAIIEMSGSQNIELPSERYQLADSTSRLNILGDNFYFKYAGGIFSIGDICLLIALIKVLFEIRAITWFNRNTRPYA